MSSPTTRANNIWEVNGGDDLLQLTKPGAGVVGGITAGGSGFGALAGGGIPAGSTGDIQFNSNDVFGNANSVAAGCSINLDTNIGSGLSFNIINGGVFFTSDLSFDVVSSSASFECLHGNMQFTADTGDMDFQSTTGNATLAGGNQVQLNSPHVNIPGLQVFLNNAAAISGGLTPNDLYRTGADPDVVCIVH